MPSLSLTTWLDRRLADKAPVSLLVHGSWVYGVVIRTSGLTATLERELGDEVTITLGAVGAWKVNVDG